MANNSNPKPYLKSALKDIYAKGNDFVLLGLTGRTGSGCSTAAEILSSSREQIMHSLFTGNEPNSNAQRKERIIYRHFESSWEPFHLIQVRSIITTFLFDGSDITSTVKKLLKSSAENVQDTEDTVIKILNDVSQEKKDDPVEFYTKILPKKCKEIEDTLGKSDFVKLYQTLGRNLRLSGEPFSETPKEGKFFTIAEKVAKVAKEILEHEKDKKKPVFVVIDAIRNPLEAIFFQKRYSSFFLVAVSAPEADRGSRLQKLNYSTSDIKEIDKNENTTHDVNEPDFFSVQDIPACLQRADIYISNPDELDEVHKFKGIANQLVRFVSLIQRPGIVTPSAVERCMQIAYTAKLNSGCISRQVGAVVTDQNFSIRAVGWNDAPHGQVPCNLRNRDDLIRGFDSSAYSVFEKTDKEYLGFFRKRMFKIESPEGKEETKYNKAFCFKSEYNKHKDEKNQVHTRSLHAEENAFLQVSKYGLAAVEGGILFTTASPCELCAKKAYQLGITDVFYIDPYPGIALSHILQGGSRNPNLKLFSGAIGHAFHQLYSPVVPYKDELEALCSDLK